jgi:pyruvate formate-lyase/glycerol dehydratase family glycyl radical enzyme
MESTALRENSKLDNLAKSNVMEARTPRTSVSERIKRLKERVMTRPYETDIERARYYTRVYKKTEGQPPCMRAAAALEETLNNMTIRIEDGELIVGSKTAKKWGGPMYIEATSNNMYTLLSTSFYHKDMKIRDVFPGGVAGCSAEFLRDVANISEGEYRELTEDIMPYWKDNSIQALRTAAWQKKGVAPAPPPEGYVSPSLISIWGVAADSIMLVTEGQGHVTVGIKKVLDLGFRGIARQAAQRLAKINRNEKNYARRKDFLEAVQVTSSAACAFAERYASLAEEMAKKTKGQRKIELLEIAERCRRVPAAPPRNMMEALQAVWLTQAMVIISYGDASITCPGRIDQYIYPFYKQDIEAGLITREKALEAIEEYYTKLATNIYFGPNNVTIGGTDKKGEDATNEVSYLFLEANKNLKGLRNGLAVRISPKTPRDFLTAACETYRTTAGVALYNDEVVIKSLLNDGYSLEDARDYSIVGCVEPTGTGNNNGYTGSNGILPVTVLEMALNQGGRSIGNWERRGLATPEASSFKTFEDVKKAYADQMAYTIELTVKRAQVKDEVIADNFPLPLLSSTIEGCVESGEDITRGGARYNHGCVTSQGLATVANSLAAIKWAVFDKKLVTMEELVKHLRNNFQGADELKTQLLKAPKYGNDDPYADEIALWVADMYNREVTKHKFWMGGVHRACLISALSQDMEGAVCGATPDGRLAGVVVSNGMSPSNGTDLNGMTALLRSGAMVSSVPVSDGTSINVTMNPAVLKTDENLDKFVSMIDAYFALGGRHVQFNPVSKATLMDAQAHPENYPELNIKVSGFSMRFIDIPKSLQDDIIARTEFTTI